MHIFIPNAQTRERDRLAKVELFKDASDFDFVLHKYSSDFEIDLSEINLKKMNKNQTEALYGMMIVAIMAYRIHCKMYNAQLSPVAISTFETLTGKSFDEFLSNQELNEAKDEPTTSLNEAYQSTASPDQENTKASE